MYSSPWKSGPSPESIAVRATLFSLYTDETGSSRSRASESGPAPSPGSGFWGVVSVFAMGHVGLKDALWFRGVRRRTANSGMTGDNHPTGEESVPVVVGGQTALGLPLAVTAPQLLEQALRVDRVRGDRRRSLQPRNTGSSVGGPTLEITGGDNLAEVSVRAALSKLIGFGVTGGNHSTPENRIVGFGRRFSSYPVPDSGPCSPNYCDVTSVGEKGAGWPNFLTMGRNEPETGEKRDSLVPSRWEEAGRRQGSVRCGVRMSASGGGTGSGADMMDTAGAVGFALIFYPDPEKERNFSVTESGFPETSLQYLILMSKIRGPRRPSKRFSSTYPPFIKMFVQPVSHWCCMMSWSTIHLKPYIINYRQGSSSKHESNLKSKKFLTPGLGRRRRFEKFPGRATSRKVLRVLLFTANPLRRPYPRKVLGVLPPFLRMQCLKKDNEAPINLPKWRTKIKRPLETLPDNYGSWREVWLSGRILGDDYFIRRSVWTSPPADTDFLHGLANSCCTGKTPPNLPLLNTNTHTRRYGREIPLEMASVPPFIPFAPSLAISSRPVPEVGVREPVLERSRTF
ncbi:hypothetical protein GEV33_003571 [Tenebrio molitor]|uniref:Uncharacterized protein n=1 Tax=Tenebrio molitor TaxID=7067 RepID=A0A8J6HI69_TENMO|nr:hypothetical protein GEV33_003571 [Tenebrio molitor]